MNISIRYGVVEFVLVMLSGSLASALDGMLSSVKVNISYGVRRQLELHVQVGGKVRVFDGYRIMWFYHPKWLLKHCMCVCVAVRLKE